MATVKADDRRRVTIPCAEPGQEFAWREDAQGVVTLTPVKPENVPVVTGKLIRKGGHLVLDIPGNWTLPDNSISDAIRRDREDE